jgi:hypothetical protein
MTVHGERRGNLFCFGVTGRDCRAQHAANLPREVLGMSSLELVDLPQQHVAQLRVVADQKADSTKPRKKQSVLLGVEAQVHVEEPSIRLDILRPAVSEQGLGGLPIAAAQGTHDVEHRSDGTIADTHGWMARLS